VEEAWGGGRALGEAIKQIKEQLREMPDHGLGYGLLRYLNGTTRAELAGLPRPQLGFNYFGRFDNADRGDWSITRRRGVLGGSQSPDMPLADVVHVNSVVLDNDRGPELRTYWSWAPNLIDRARVQALAEDWFHVLETLVCSQNAAVSINRTASDISLVSLSQDEIDFLETQF
jgi:non-ribosomal peptide synthase protein (TIGR01720 family)